MPAHQPSTTIRAWEKTTNESDPTKTDPRGGGACLSAIVTTPLAGVYAENKPPVQGGMGSRGHLPTSGEVQ